MPSLSSACLERDKVRLIRIFPLPRWGWVGGAFGLDKRTIRRSHELYRLIIEPFPDLVEALAAHPIVGENAAQLKAIAAIRDQAQRRQAIELLIADPELSADLARVEIGLDTSGGPAPVKHQKFYDQIESGWGRLGLPERRRFLPTIAAMLTPEMKRELRDRLTADLGDAPTGLQPAVAMCASVKPDYIVCLEDGTRHVNLTRWIARLGMTPADYRARWSLSADYPFLAPNYSQNRRETWRALVRARHREAANAR